MTIKDIKEKGLLLFECIAGSKAYGLNTPESDTDIKGVFYLPKEQYYGLDYIAQVNNESNDEIYYEIGRFVELLIKSNPNMLELLATPEDCILYKDPIIDKLELSMFLSKNCKETFAGYAITQIKKAKGLKKKIVNPFPEERKAVLDFCFIMVGYTAVPLKEWTERNNYRQEQCGLAHITHTKGLYALFYDEKGILKYNGIIHSPVADDVTVSSIPKDEKEIAYMYFNIESYSSYCKEYKEYWEWVKNRNEVRYHGTLEHGKDYDAKNMMHTIRLLEEAEEILREGKLNVKRTNRETLLAIKTGKFEYSELLQMADALILSIDKAYLETRLPDKVDADKVKKILVEIRTRLYSIQRA